MLLLLLLPCAEAVLADTRTAYYASEPIPLVLSGLKKGASAKLEIVPKAKGFSAVRIPLAAQVDSPSIDLPPGLLAPGAYALSLDGKEQFAFTVSHGVNRSRLLLSATVADPKKAGSNFFLGNAFEFGLLDKGMPMKDVRGKRSRGMEVFEKAIRDELPTVVYMYWTGYVTHKPFGSEKSWAADDMGEAMRLLSLHTAQRLRRYKRNIEMVGTLDEPGLSWGKTPAGGMASGFPNWDEQGWYRKRGWDYTDDPGSRPDRDWLGYMVIRCGIMKERMADAKRDLKTVWPGVVFSTDLYAPQAIMDGTDPLNQQVNDIPSSHVFLDWGCGKLGALSGLYLEKADAPSRRIAHAMNGQLFGKTVAQPAQRHAYRLMLNAMLAAGLHSNWWLNPTGMKEEDLAWVNEPALRWGSLLRAHAPTGHDVAVLWSFTEAAMRQKDVAAKEAKKKEGEQIRLLIASMPDVPGAKDKSADINAYSVGGNYKEQVLNAHQAIARAGWPAHILHELVLAERLKDYKTLVIVGQTFDLPADARKTLAAWQAKGGKVVIDGTTTARIEGAAKAGFAFRDPQFRWNALFNAADKKDHKFKSEREASVYQTNWYMDGMARDAVPAMRAALKKTASVPAIVTDDLHLAAERHLAAGGKQQLIMVMNALEKLGDIPQEERHPIYNHAAHESTFSLAGLPKGAQVWCIEGSEWKKVSKLADPAKPIKAAFEPGEMKLYLVLEEKTPAAVKHLTALRKGGGLEILASCEDEAKPAVLPFTLAIHDPKGKELYRVHRTTDEKGEYAERFPIGTNAPQGAYRVEMATSLVPGTASVRGMFTVPDLPLKLPQYGESAEVLDKEAVKKFVRGKGPFHVVAAPALKEEAERLAKAVGGKVVSDELRKVAYPRVWNPYATVFTVGGKEAKPGPVKRTATEKEAGDWQPETLVAIKEGWVDCSGERELCYGAGVKLYIDAKGKRTVLNAAGQEEKTTPEFRSRWARAWTRLTTHVGAYQLPPQLPEAYTAEAHLIVLGNNAVSQALQASELLPRVVDARYPGPKRALLQYAWGPFKPGLDAVWIGATDAVGAKAGVDALLKMRE
ncbi:MAG: hypothetical protein K2W96_03530 [Gemmataceae bacterium]|nr:hypothetical protein [Gemmataceae bacterium]